ncbi:MAG: proline--tRNA ligase [Candidatus Pacebacteria bacterium CG_4_10_14_3_um_filter_34_15]|nr:proline--tRNA ligase [Candidatus Pacearchaeota archaeon]NCQ65869.1 proline--tRNA ligase [Candidatus Paceibacterota bacterium]OIO44808.1 MAG: proline--tRNA ligase [Candidatus Pacebacteria bacterium CG1_02_43_31]PIQ81427.1 MAG: proline--tRNA ligase [Candidatus Pacebacteria bacterium CG11_big_fil_rev_8_21_14_0_20_34_55]PIX81139.1 MAG: proline--tRNA ligase [Candidatus Pacebacteria bacterium CG_4_10_14_3_um_filter_34_15]PJC43537.1 MAG: proline--tRNA ligase [Candidatus Pacebacteria bacterium CG_4
MAKRNLTPKSENMSKWYTQVIQQAKLADYSPVKGCMVFRPNGYGIWENIQKSYQQLLDKMEVKNAYFPIFIPMSFLEKEADHIEGFAPELAIVTHAGGEELAEKLVIRPTSETIMYDMYSKWVQSHRDLPIKINQWNNVVRWEKRTNFFLRTTEFLWQEAHSAHANKQEAIDLMYEALASYREIAEDYLAIPVVTGKKSESEKFAGANLTTTIEAMMPDGKALQSGTSHHLGQNFSKKDAFNISFQNSEGQTEYAWQNSWGLSTRIIGAIIMTHGDDDGVVMPPKVAPTQVAIVAASQDKDIIAKVKEIKKQLQDADIRTASDISSETSLGWKLNDTELTGIPVTLIVGKRELENGKLTANIRFTKTKQKVSLENLIDNVKKILDSIQSEMFKKALERTKELTHSVENYDDFKKIMLGDRGFIKAFWCENEDCEKAIKEETKATTRCLPFTDNKGLVKEEDGVCIKCGKKATHRWLFAQAY